MTNFHTQFFLKKRQSSGINLWALDLMAPVAITINRGTEPSLVEMLIRDEESGGTRYDEFENPVALRIYAPDSAHNSQYIDLEEWYITHHEPHSPGIRKLILQDKRWEVRHRRVTAEYNIFVAGYGSNPVRRESSLNNGSLWTCYDAAKDAMEKFGLEFEKTPGFPKNLKNRELPRNLGNSFSGGFVEATLGFIIPKLLDPIHCDIVQMPNGKYRIVDRSTKLTNDLDQYIGVEGVVSKRDRHWSKPKKITVHFEQRVARFFNYNEIDPVTQTSSGDGDDLPIANVIPFEAVGAFDSIINEGHTELLDEVNDKFGISLSDLRDRWFKPRIIPIDTQNDDAEDIDYKNKWEAWIRECFRQKFRIEDNEGLASLVDLRTGHLGVDGSTRSEKSVYMPFCYIHKYTHLYHYQELEDILETDISTNVNIDYKSPAPWLPVIYTDAFGEVIIQLIPQIKLAPYAREIFPGKTGKPITFGDAADIDSDIEALKTLHQASFTNWTVRVFYHGLLIKDRPDLGIDRLHIEERNMFSNGEVDNIDYRVSDMTANWGYETADDLQNDNLTLLNESELKERADFIKKQVKRGFTEGDAGVFVTGGIEAIKNGDFWVDGNIHSMTILLGAKKPYSVECHWIVQPEVRPTYANRLDLQGQPVRRIG